ncbi:hypothetical protein HAX54_017965, partial [Datura stramonium]|nr:hypothetical protein [Datura stramonium]
MNKGMAESASRRSSANAIRQCKIEGWGLNQRAARPSVIYRSKIMDSRWSCL